MPLGVYSTIRVEDKVTRIHRMKACSCITLRETWRGLLLGIYA